MTGEHHSMRMGPTIVHTKQTYTSAAAVTPSSTAVLCEEKMNIYIDTRLEVVMSNNEQATTTNGHSPFRIFLFLIAIDLGYDNIFYVAIDLGFVNILHHGRRSLCHHLGWSVRSSFRASLFFRLLLTWHVGGLNAGEVEYWWENETSLLSSNN
jgi:hypothetical protein